MRESKKTKLMGKKPMGYKVYPRPTKGQDGKPLLYVRPVGDTTYDVCGLDEYCHEYMRRQRGEMKQFFETFIEAASHLMSEGARIVTPIGSFQAKLKLNGDFTDPEQISNRDVELESIEFQPAKLFVDELKSQIFGGFQKKVEPIVRRPLHELRQEGLLEQAYEEALKRRSFTIKWFAYHAGISYSTARDFLNAHSKGEHAQLKKEKIGNIAFFFPQSGTEQME